MVNLARIKLAVKPTISTLMGTRSSYIAVIVFLLRPERTDRHVCINPSLFTQIISRLKGHFLIGWVERENHNNPLVLGLLFLF